MNLGFYYHLPASINGNCVSIPAYLGLFIDALAEDVESLILFVHEARPYEIKNCDYIIKHKNLQIVSLGLKTPAWERFIWPQKTLKKIKNQIAKCDVILVRAPSPLAPAFYSKYGKLTQIVYLVVGDYIDGIKHLYQPWWKLYPIKFLTILNDRQLSRVLANSLTLVNSTALVNRYLKTVNNLHEVRTTNLTSNDFYFRETTCTGDDIKLLYTGRLDVAKGLRELIKATSLLLNDGKKLSLHIVGWEDDTNQMTEFLLRKDIESYGIGKYVFFHGRKTTGSELNLMYRMADIYIIPSYHEGFPRTIWEAMANSVPVIATKVGSIPYFLESGTNALLIEPKNVSQIIEAIELIINNPDLRKKLIYNSFILAKENTLELQTKKMVQILKDNCKINKS